MWLPYIFILSISSIEAIVVKEMHDIKGWLEPHLIDIHSHTYQRCFLFKREGKSVKGYCRRLMYTLPEETNGPVKKGWEPLPEFMKSCPTGDKLPNVRKKPEWF